MGWSRLARVSGLLALAVGVVVLSTALLPSAVAATATTDEDVTIIARDLGDHGRRLSDTQRGCLNQFLAIDPTITTELRVTGTLHRLAPENQRRVFDIVARCAAAELGRALTATFLTFSRRHRNPPTITSDQYGCIGGTATATLVPMLDKNQRTLTVDAMTVFARVLYLCATEYVVSGPLPRTFNINQRQSRCLADRLMLHTTLIPEVARLMFRQGDQKRSPALRRLIADCTTRRTTPPST